MGRRVPAPALEPFQVRWKTLWRWTALLIGLIVTPPRRRLRRRHAVIRFKHRAAASRELRGVLTQARHDPVGVGYLFAAKPEHVGRAGKLLFERSPIFLGGRRRLQRDAAGDRQRYSGPPGRLACPILPLDSPWIHPGFTLDSKGAQVPCRRKGRPSDFKMNAARKGSSAEKIVKARRTAPTPPCRSSSPPRSGGPSLRRRIWKIPARPCRRPGCPRSRRSLSLPGFAPPAPSPRAAAS